MRVLCPHCQTEVEPAAGADGKLLCPSCGRGVQARAATAATAVGAGKGSAVNSSAALPIDTAATTHAPPKPKQSRSAANPSSASGESLAATDPGASGIRQAIREQPTLGSYTIIGEVGRGGMGRVFKAVHRTLRQVRAIKVLSKNESHDEKVVARFQREARIVAALDHPHIVKLFEFEQEPQRGHYYFVMEYVDGGSVGRILKRQGRLPWQQAAEITLQVALGLAEMNKHSLVHRDIKPSNILIDRLGMAKLADLGLARHEGDGADTQLTATGAVMGTIDYMAPEQIVDARHADIRSDLYALGCTLFHMLAGRVPFPDGSAYQKIQQQINDPLPEVGPLAHDVPFQLVLILNRLTEKDPNNRYQTPLELIADLQHLTGEPPPTEDLNQSTIMQLQALAEAAAKDRSPASPSPPATGELPANVGPSVSLTERLVPLTPWVLGGFVVLAAGFLMWMAVQVFMQSGPTNSPAPHNDNGTPAENPPAQEPTGDSPSDTTSE